MAIAVAVERWPALLPSYRRVRYHGRSGSGHAYQFDACLGPATMRWTAEQLVFAGERRIVYRHLRGVPTGMWSEWRLSQAGDGVSISVRHTWHQSTPVIGRLAETLACRLLVQPLTERTLVELAALLRSGQASAIGRLTAAFDVSRTLPIPD